MPEVRQPTVAFSSLDIFYEPNPLVIDRRGSLAALVDPRLFSTFAIAPDSVSYNHNARSCKIGITQAQLFLAGSTQAPAISWLFRALKTSGLKTVASLRMRIFYAFEEPNIRLIDLVNAHSADISRQHFDPAPFGEIIDTGTVYTIQRGDRRMNLQFGPMGRSQWKSLAEGPTASIEADLPETSWGLGVWDIQNVTLAKPIEEAERFVATSVVEWGTLSHESLLRR